MTESPYSDAELEAALAAIAAPARLQQAENLVTRAAPSLQRVLATALQEGGWFDGAQEQAIREAAATEDDRQRVRAVQTLLAEETRLGMMVGVAVGFELARELGAAESSNAAGGTRAPGPAGRPGDETENQRPQEIDR